MKRLMSLILLTSVAAWGEVPAQIASWPVAQRKSAAALVERYGRPDDVTGRALIWHLRSPWQRIVLFRDATRTKAPYPHDDLIQLTIRYRVPPQKIAALVRFDPSIVVNKARETVSASAESEAAATLALNLANEMVEGQRDSASAAAFMRKTLRMEASGKESRYTEGLLFTPPGTSFDASPSRPSQESLGESSQPKDESAQP